MDFNIEFWLQELTKQLFDIFDDRIKFVGLQGSYKRGESNENSDIDVVIILDKLNFDDLQQYKKILQSMPDNEKACGFICGENELYNWPKSDLFQLSQDTISLYGNLENFIPAIEKSDIEDFVKINSANLYHQMNHAYLFEDKDINILKQGYKTAFFILQGMYYLKNGEYPNTKSELLLKLDGENKDILLVNVNWKKLKINNNLDFYFEKIINWSSKNINL